MDLILGSSTESSLSTSWHSYPSIYALGHAALAELLLDEVTVEEKVDGSQFSFGLFMDEGESPRNFGLPYLRIRSKGAEMLVDAPERMFQKAVDAVKERASILTPGWTYRAEYLAKPKHNALAYDRVPNDHLVIFDINTGHEQYLAWEQKAGEARRLGLEVIPLLYFGKIESLSTFRPLLDATSFLGGQKIEGVVVKNYKRFGRDKKILLGKFVSEAFKETHAKVWKADNPNSKDIIQRLIETYHTQARWMKAVQHLREAGKLEESPRDIGSLFREVPADIEKECEAEIKQKLFDWAWPQISRGVTAGLPAWYKEELLKKQFEADPDYTTSTEMLKDSRLG